MKQTNEIIGTETLTYTNNSPDKLGFCMDECGSEFI